MSELQDAVNAVQNFARQPITDFDALPRSDSQFLNVDCFQQVLALCHQAEPSERSEVIRMLTPLIASTPDIVQASRVAMLCGILVEWEADPTIAVGAIIERLTIQMTSAVTLAGRVSNDNEAHLFGESPEKLKAWKSLHPMILAAMTMLCVDMRARQQARSNVALVECIRTLAPARRDVKFLERLFKLVDGEQLIILHPGEKCGFRVQLQAVCTNYHLFSLLQGALVNDSAAGYFAAPRPNRKVIATATGEMPHDRLITDSAIWHYANFAALRPDGTLTAIPESTWIRGEETPYQIPEFEGERVVLLGAPLASNGWDSSFFTNLHDALRSRVEVIEILSKSEVETRLRRIRDANQRAT